MRIAEVFEALDEPDRATELRRKAAELRRRFEDTFWCEDVDFYAFTLDPQKRPVKTISSNAGHLLWSGIVHAERAGRVVKRLLEPDMWSGWGIRTLSSENPAYNPLSYQRAPCGRTTTASSPWASGATASPQKPPVLPGTYLARRAPLRATAYPELYAGIERRPATFPVLYAGANVPQAWAAGTVFHLLQALLGLQADAPNGRLFVDPALPGWLPDVTLHGVKVGTDALDLQFWREGERSRWKVLAQTGDIHVQEPPWRPWPLDGAPQEKPNGD